MLRKTVALLRKIKEKAVHTVKRKENGCGLFLLSGGKSSFSRCGADNRKQRFHVKEC